MIARCGSKIIKLFGKEYEIPLLASILISNNKEFFYISGSKVVKSGNKDRWLYILKNIQTNEFSNIDYHLIEERRINNLVDIYNVGEDYYALPVLAKDEAREMINKFHPLYKKPEIEFKNKFKEFIIIE